VTGFEEESHSMRVELTMAFLVVFRSTSRTAAFHSGSSFGRTSTRLSGSFFDDLGKSFSSMTGGGESSSSKYYTVGITGASGLIGTALQDELSKKGVINGKPIRLVKLTRGSQAETKALGDELSTTLVWNPKATSPEEVVDPAALKLMDALIHLSGENISTGLSGPLAPVGIRPWTDEKKQEILDSRTITTTALSNALASNKKKLSFLVASGVGAYGPNFIGEGVTAADESADISKSEGFLAEVSRQWEAASEGAKKSGSRVVNLRNGVVLSKQGGAMAKLFPIFFLGGGGIVGSGKQYFPFISSRDMARAMVHVLETPSLKGPVNMCAPGGATNAEFTEAMGKVMGRPTLLPFPGFAVSLLFGEMGEEILLGGTRATPKKLMDSGFQFSHPTVVEAVQSAVDESI
jgi:uncharacterized protein (TIGR01777 family)